MIARNKGPRRAVRRALRRLWRREDGTSTIEFVLCIPVLFMLFMASMESGLYMIRHVMMERALDIVMRDFRLGRLTPLDHNDVRDLVCAATPMEMNCDSKMKVWMEPLNTSSWAMPDEPTFCGNGNGTLTPPPSGVVAGGESNQLMYVRICTVLEPLFPSTGIGLQLRADSQTGGYQIATSTIVVVEPH